MWSFGYGSNMDVKALEAKKHVKIHEHSPAFLVDHKLGFSLKGLSCVEPAYANIEESKGSEIHGVAFKMDEAGLEELDRTEMGYNKKKVTLVAYDGRNLDGFVYMSKNPPTQGLAPSSRYLGVLIKGAKQAGLRSDYIDGLSKTKTYQVPDWITKARAETRIDMKELPEISVEELSKHKDQGDVWIACLGYVVKIFGDWAFQSHKGRDVTTRVLMQYHGIPMDDNDDKGKPPYPIVNDLSEGELEYVSTWLDHFQFRGMANENEVEKRGEIKGFLREFKLQQLEGKTKFVLPEIPQ